MTFFGTERSGRVGRGGEGRECNILSQRFIWDWRLARNREVPATLRSDNGDVHKNDAEK